MRADPPMDDGRGAHGGQRDGGQRDGATGSVDGDAFTL